MQLAFLCFLPFLASIFNGFWYLFAKKPWKMAAGVVSTLALFTSFCLASALAFHDVTFSLPWIATGSFELPFVLRLDHLSSIFVLVITGVGTLIHIYATVYMAHDSGIQKFFAYLSLFCGSMLVLVLGGSLPILFCGWEGVGLCSYLLISFWFDDSEKAKAGAKAFIVNRIGDVGFLLGMFVLFQACGSLDIETLTHAQLSPTTVLIACSLLFFACTGKSAQIPLYIWLPDAMAGPTPVSALIHAATMVTSGVYLVTRLHVLFDAAESLHIVMATVGGVTAFVAATIALVQDDIKKVLAYSTVSQLGYLFLACGVGAYEAAVFHVVTHAFFKALLFLAAGSVIHGMDGEQNMWKMGGLKKAMPVTFATFTLGWLAICGIPPFSGFFSKDEILFHTFTSGHTGLWALGLVTACMTAFYMTRLYIVTFLGTKHTHAHESSWGMLAPLCVLACLSALGGIFGHMISHTLAFHAEAESSQLEWILMLVSACIAGLGIALAFFMYDESRQPIRARIQKQYGWLSTALAHAWYVDEAIDLVLLKPLRQIYGFVWRTIDVLCIDGFIMLLASGGRASGDVLRLIQPGFLHISIACMVMGAFFIMGYMVYGQL